MQNPFGESTGYAWDIANRLNTITLANGSVVSLRYDNASRLAYIGDNATTGLGFSYGLDANGNRTVITENDGSQVNNTYDAKNRFTLETRTGTSAYSNGYSYDLNDNLTSVRGTSYSVDIMGRITNAGFVYDANGRLTARPGSDGTTYLNYDYAGRVTSMTLGAGLTITYALDGDGRAQRESRGGKNHYYLLGGKNVLKEWGTQTVTVTSHAGTPAGNVALRPRDLVRLATATGASVTVSITQGIIDYTHGLGLISDRTTMSRWYRWDGIGSLRNLENSSGSIVASSVFDAYGLQQNATTLVSAYGFIGEQGVRGEKGLAPGTLVPQNMRARMYDPLTGRFTSWDPIWDKNLYQYANGNPFGFTDPNGMQAQLSEHVYRRLLATITDDYPNLSPQELRRIELLLRKIVREHDGRWKDITYEPARELQNILDSEYHKFVLQQRGLHAWHPPQNAWPGEAQQWLQRSGITQRNRMWGVLQRDILSLAALRNRYPHSERYGWFRDIHWQAKRGNAAAEQLDEDWATAITPTSLLSREGESPYDREVVRRLFEYGKTNHDKGVAQAGLMWGVVSAMGSLEAAIKNVPRGAPRPAAIQAVEWAIMHLGDPEYGGGGLYPGHGPIGPVGPRAKCNIFACDTYALGAGLGWGGKGVPTQGWFFRKHYYAANQLGDSDLMLPHFAVTRRPQLGDIVAWKNSAIGHSGIYIGGGILVYATDTGEGSVKIGTIAGVTEFESGIPPTYRTYSP